MGHMAAYRLHTAIRSDVARNTSNAQTKNTQKNEQNMISMQMLIKSMEKWVYSNKINKDTERETVIYLVPIDSSYDCLSVINTNLRAILHRFRDITFEM